MLCGLHLAFFIRGLEYKSLFATQTLYEYSEKYESETKWPLTFSLGLPVT